MWEEGSVTAAVGLRAEAKAREEVARGWAVAAVKATEAKGTAAAAEAVASKRASEQSEQASQRAGEQASERASER